MKRVYFSDVHMGKQCPKEDGSFHPNNYVWLDTRGKKQSFKNFIDNYLRKDDSIDEIILVGDILDNWVVPIDVKPPTFKEILQDTTIIKDKNGIALPSNADIANSLVELSNQKEVIYLPGNHDMGIDKATIKGTFPKMMYGGNHLNGLQYITDYIIAEHGTSQAMFNGPDPESDPATKIPLGYFFSRIAATMEAQTGSALSIFDVIKGLLGSGADLAQKAINTVVNAAGLSRDDKILIEPGHPIFDPDGDGHITVGEVRARYWDVYSRYERAYKEKRRKLPPIDGASVDASNTSLMVGPLNEDNGTYIAIMGHTHDELHNYYPNAQSKEIYANCGAWCNKPNAMNPMSGHFIETISDSGKTELRLKYWDDTNNRC